MLGALVFGEYLWGSRSGLGIDLRGPVGFFGVPGVLPPGELFPGEPAPGPPGELGAVFRGAVFPGADC
ncbi:hypothetical protein EEB19_09855 [Gordonia sp. OPL2]|nr:hypothetical protein EEB19_09855 [Gordonia sp. OPL2]